MVKRIALLGATGSIGSSTFSVVAEQTSALQIVMASAHKDYEKLCPLAIKHGIPLVVFTGISEAALQTKIRADYPQLGVYFGNSDLLKLLRETEYEIGQNAIGGSAGIEASFAILEAGKDLALANKESLVMGGHLVKKLKAPGKILPVDSEHSAIFQALGSHPNNEIRKLIITASGGSFRTLPLCDFDKITPAMALKHPNWDMGAKVTLDSATMFNKALEVMEAHWLFDLPYTQIEAIIHPQSIIHSLVEFCDGSLLAQLSSPDMKLPILYALSYPNRWPSNLVKTNLWQMPDLSFQAIEKERYPLFYLGLEVAQAGGIMPTVMNAAVEAAMSLFLSGKIRFIDIYPLVRDAIEKAEFVAEPELECILQVNRDVYLEIVNR